MPKILIDTRPLRASPAYARLWWGLGLSQIGAQVTVMAVGLEVYLLTRSTLAVGLLGLFALVPTILMGLYGGALADAFDRKKVALVAAAITVVGTSGLVLQSVLGLRSPVALYLLTAVTAAGASMSAPVRMAIIPRLVGIDLLPAANALGMLTGSLALTAGPMLGGLLAAGLGYGWTYAIDLALFAFALYALVRLPAMPPERPGAGRVIDDDVDEDDVDDDVRGDDAHAGPAGVAPAEGPPGPEPSRKVGLGAVWEGFRFLADRPNIRMTFVLDIVAMVTAMPRVLFPAVGAILIGGGETTAGQLTAAIAIGSLLASALSGGLTRVRWQGLAIVMAIVAFGLCTSAFGVVLLVLGRASGEPVGVVVWALVVGGLCLVGAGACDAISAVFRQTVLQAATPDHLRGRLQGIFIVVVTGGPRIGDVVVGGAAEAFGEALAALGGGLACATIVAAVALRQRGFLRYDARHPTP